MKLKVNSIILNYNGRDLLEKYLPSILDASRASRHDCCVTVLDNASQDDSVSFVESHFPEVRVFRAKENKVLCSYNDALRNFEDDIVILLNNDMAMEKGFIDPLIEVFQREKDAFFAASHGNRSIAKFRWGILDSDVSYPNHERYMAEAGLSLSAGIAAFDRRKFLELGGYDEIYLPGRYEDVDLCYRGWKRGWKGYYVPQSRQVHEGGTSFARAFDSETIQALVFRNSLLFMVKNVTDPLLLARFAGMSALRLVAALILQKRFILRGFAGALKRLPATLKSRASAKKLFFRSDAEVLRLVNQDYRKKKAVNLLRAFVDWLGLHPEFQKVFFFLTFLNLRLIFPLQYLILRELVNCKSVLDLGCGRHSMVPILPSKIRTVGVELYPPSYEEAIRKNRHTEYVQADITKVDFPDKSFDAVVLLDVVEHLPKEAGLALLAKMERWARKKVIVFTPNGFMHQHDHDGNPYMEHQSGWTESEMSGLGFRVRGVRGFKAWKKDTLEHAEATGEKIDSFADVSQILTYHFPSTAFQLFCVKELGRS